MLRLYTELDELRTAASYLQRGMTAPATFSLFVHTLPPHHGFLVAAGLADALDYLEGFRLDDADLDRLRHDGAAGAGGLADDAVDVLAGLRFTGDVWAMPEGRIAFPGEPLLEVTASIAEAQAVRAALLHIVGRQTAVASEAARCRLAVSSGRPADAPPAGGATPAPPAAAPGTVAGAPQPRFVTLGADGHTLSPLAARDVPDGGEGVGSEPGAAGGHYLDIAYELVAYGDRPVMKLSAGKVTLPGAKQVFRDEHAGEDLLALRGEPTPARHVPLLLPVMAAGSRLGTGDEHGPADDVAAAHRRFEADLARLPERTAGLDRPAPTVPAVSVALRRLHDEGHERLIYRELLGQRSGPVAGCRIPRQAAVR